MSVRLTPVSLETLRDVVLGKITDLPRVHAISLLRDSDFPNKHRDFETVLKDESEPARIRVAAATLLGTLDTAAAREILVAHASVADEAVQAAVLMALGRTGFRAELEAIERAGKSAKGLAAERAAFAAALISQRLGLAGNDLPPSKDADLLPVPGEGAIRIEVQRADPAEVETCLRHLQAQPFGIAYAEQNAYRVTCGKRAMMILLNREFAGAGSAQALRSRKTFFGVVTGRNDSTQADFVSLLILTAPRQGTGEFDIFLHHPTGERSYAGSGKAEDTRATFRVQAVARPGSPAVLVAGTLEDGTINVSAATSTPMVVRQPRTPIKG